MLASIKAAEIQASSPSACDADGIVRLGTDGGPLYAKHAATIRIGSATMCELLKELLERKGFVLAEEVSVCRHHQAGSGPESVKMKQFCDLSEVNNFRLSESSYLYVYARPERHKALSSLVTLLLLYEL